MNNDDERMRERATLFADLVSEVLAKPAQTIRAEHDEDIVLKCGDGCDGTCSRCQALLRAVRLYKISKAIG